MGDTEVCGTSWEDRKLQECFEGTKSYLQLVGTLSEAGSSWSHGWVGLLEQTPYAPLAQQFHATCHEIQQAVSHDTEQVLADIVKIQDKLTQNGRKATAVVETEEDKPPSNDSTHSGEDFKMVAKSFLSLVTLHCQIFLKASMSLAQFAKITYAEDSKGLPVCPELPTESSSCKPDAPLDGKSETIEVSTTKSDTNKHAIGSPSGLRKLSSFLSKLGRAGSSPSPTDLSQSLFYVEMPDMSGEQMDRLTAKQKSSSQAAGGEQPNQNPSGANNTKDSISQEELDSVIDFLSGFKVPMQTIHEHPPAQLHSNSRVVGSQLNHAYKDGMDYYNSLVIERPKQNQSPKTNTWPYRPPSKAAVGDMSSPYSAFGLGESVTADQEYWRYLNAVRSMKQSGGDAMANRSAWSNAATEAVPHRTWPHHVIAQDTYEGNGRGWSCVHGDSSSCSDDSSNGEAPWMMGLDLMNSANSKRRHSSGEDGLMPSTHMAAGAVRQHPTDSRPRSVEDLLEAKSNKTWPPKQPWLKGAAAEGGREESPAEGSSCQPMPSQPYHPPLTMQWSDPLTNRPLSTWGTGLNPSLSNQSMTNYGSGVL